MKKKNLIAAILMVSIFIGNSPVIAANFTDSSDVPWRGAETYINLVADTSLMVGDHDTKGYLVFRAKDGVSYCETIQLIYALTQKTTGNAQSQTFQDKWKGALENNRIPSWAWPAVAYGLENNIITSSELAGFVDLDGLSLKAVREDVALMFGRAMQNYGTLKTAPVLGFQDHGDINPAKAPYIELLSQLNIISGDNMGNFNPQKSINRAEMAVIVSKSYELMKAGPDEIRIGSAVKNTPITESKSVTGTVKSVSTVAESTTLVIKGSSEISLVGTDLTPAIDIDGERLLLSQIEAGDSVVLTYADTDIQSVLVTSGSKAAQSAPFVGKPGTFYAVTDKNIKIKEYNSIDTYSFAGNDYKNVSFYINGAEADFGAFKSKATTSSSISLKMDNTGKVNQVYLLTLITGTYISADDGTIKITSAGKTNTYSFRDKNFSSVVFKIDGKASTFDKFKDNVTTSTKVELILNDSNQVKEINLIAGDKEITARFVSMTSSAFTVRINDTTVSYGYPGDNYNKTKFNVIKVGYDLYPNYNYYSTSYYRPKEETKILSYSFSDYRNVIKAGDKLTLELDSNGCIKNVYLNNASQGSEVTGILEGISGSGIRIKKKYMQLDNYSFNNDKADDVLFYLEDELQPFKYVVEHCEIGSEVTLVLNSKSEITKVYIWEKINDDD